jgi:hypothetical protein
MKIQLNHKFNNLFFFYPCFFLLIIIYSFFLWSFQRFSMVSILIIVSCLNLKKLTRYKYD